MNDTIAAISTAQGIGAISIIRISGPKAFSIVEKIFTGKKFKEAASHTIHYGYIKNGDEKIDEVLVSKMCAPKTFTCEDIVEINSHGGIITTNKILELLLTHGCTLAEPGEFTKRAFLNGRIDLTEAESIMDLINAKTEDASKIALNGVSGKLSNLIKDLRNDLAAIITNIEVNIDYPEYEDIEEMTITKINENLSILKEKINKILKQSNTGEILKTGIKTVIIGRPNVGKSSILNCLVGEEKAIVTDVKGTTRDSVEASIVIDNIILNLIDTAGIRKTEDIVESIGVDKSLKLIDDADLVLFVVNYNEKITEDDKKIITKLKNKNYITVINKTDLEKQIDDENLNNKIYVSALKNENVENISQEIKKLFNLEQIETSDLTYLTGARNKAILNQVITGINEISNGIKNNYPIDMIEIDLRNIWNLLGQIIGEVYEEKLLDELFSRFCVGK